MIKVYGLCTTLLFLLLSIPARAAHEYEIALREYSARRYSTAADQFALVWKNDPSNANAAYYAAYSYLLAGQRQQAVQGFQDLIVAFPSRKEAAMARAVLRHIAPTCSPNAVSKQPSEDRGKVTTENSTKLSPAEIVEKLVVVSPPRGKLPKVTPEFVSEIKSMLVALPLPVLAFLHDVGCHITITPSVIEKDFRIQNTVPRGWDGEASWKDSPAMFDGKDVVISEYHADQRTDEYVRCTNEIGVVRHETGHALDRYSGNLTEAEEFKHAYFLDAAKVPEELKGKLAYFLQPGDAGPAETFAELFCHKAGGETDKGRMQACDLVHQYFPLCNQVLGKVMNDLASRYP